MTKAPNWWAGKMRIKMKLGFKMTACADLVF